LPIHLPILFAGDCRDAGIASTTRATLVETARAQRLRRAHRAQDAPSEDRARHEARSGN